MRRRGGMLVSQIPSSVLIVRDRGGSLGGLAQHRVVPYQPICAAPIALVMCRARRDVGWSTAHRVEWRLMALLAT